ncbi:hypothetical protein G7Y89_g10992 [Cudoniella acicularis]|uniref:Heterokaryon incompatibility domain-containing protein n=1 Tax=Cudoniella acicularis TaxID=354080 RepID=A0A8H4RBQ2_9HELO|nr:hypothetical protein G7Y89_g10992 [Cudoniella acicularis]
MNGHHVQDPGLRLAVSISSDRGTSASVACRYTGVEGSLRENLVFYSGLIRDPPTGALMSCSINEVTTSHFAITSSVDFRLLNSNELLCTASSLPGLVAARETLRGVPFTTSNGQRARSARLKVISGGFDIDVVDFALTSFAFEIYMKNYPLAAAGKLVPISPYRELCLHPESDECWEVARTWLSSCKEGHAACQRVATAVLPRRLLDISEIRPRLIDAQSICSGTKYTALSHCWGSYNTMSTHKSNVQSFMEGIDMFLLPPTYQDAIKVTRRLGVQFIWIDSLCIIQDSREDWQAESVKMVDVYKNCYLNISALSAANASQGFLLPRPRMSTVHLENDLHLRPATQPWREVFQQSPLSQRSWVLQERLLSTRVLHFGKDDMFWECLTLSVRESNATEYTKQAQSTEWEDENFKRSLFFTKGKWLHSPLVHPDYQCILARWYAIVLQYATLHITIVSDTFPAISGIAAEIHNATGCHYIAGLWIEDLHTGLLWYRDGECYSGPYIAPTWSWAARRGPIQWLYLRSSSSTHDPYMAEIQKTDVVLQNPENEFGVVQAGHLYLDAYTKPVWYRTSHGDPPFNDPYLSVVLDIFDTDGLPLGTGYLDDLADSATPAKLTAMVVTQRRMDIGDNGSDSEGDAHEIIYFLLIKMTGIRENEYRRVGIGYTFDSLIGEVVSNNAFKDCSSIA